MDKIKILVACHKPCSVYHDNVYLPIHTGRATSPYRHEMGDMIGDDTGDNISEKNPLYCELTAQYWAWKNLHDTEYIGFCHYRRFFDIQITDNNIDPLMKNKDVILLGYKRKEIVERMSRSVSLEDMTIFLMVLKKMHPEYEQATIDYLWGNKLYHKNMLICRKNIFDKYAEWIFGVLLECERYIRKSPYSRGARVYGYLAEIFMPVYFLHNGYRILTTKVIDKDIPRRNRVVDLFYDLGKDFYFQISKLYFKKPNSFEDYYLQSVLLGLKNDNIQI